MPIGDCEEPGMAKFLDVHHGFAGVAECQLREARERDLVTEAAEGQAERVPPSNGDRCVRNHA